LGWKRGSLGLKKRNLEKKLEFEVKKEKIEGEKGSWVWKKEILGLKNKNLGEKGSLGGK